MMIKKIALALTLALGACSSAPSHPPPTCAEACRRGSDDLVQWEGPDAGGGDAGTVLSCRDYVFGVGSGSDCEYACNTNPSVAACMMTAWTCDDWTKCALPIAPGAG
jgi:hypothetical protein